ncbi:unnamed protein product [Sphenostylis stenocarpa]|uniref:Uncharacterized protein n=1 Tax=Sphenostylis stenocarpa TaxID=92480 RepID=A0AA86W217_9FABA|nr:unnamed protein product [Sphenostylis stenocarpa]
MGNHQLCGPPLTMISSQDEKSHNTKPIGDDDDDDDDDDTSAVKSWSYMAWELDLRWGFGELSDLDVHPWTRYLNQSSVSSVGSELCGKAVLCLYTRL